MKKTFFCQARVFSKTESSERLWPDERVGSSASSREEVLQSAHWSGYQTFFFYLFCHHPPCSSVIFISFHILQPCLCVCSVSALVAGSSSRLPASTSSLVWWLMYIFTVWRMRTDQQEVNITKSVAWIRLFVSFSVHHRIKHTIMKASVNK